MFPNFPSIWIATGQLHTDSHPPEVQVYAFDEDTLYSATVSPSDAYIYNHII